MLHRMFKVFLSAFVCLLLVITQLHATTISIVNNDDANEGFNDTTVVSPVGGNSGITLGQQRQNVFEYAASIWESIIHSNVEILIGSQFDPLECTSTSAVLGSAGPNTIARDFTNAPLAETYYPAALANSLANTDISSSLDISATFNADIDNNNDCLNNYNWYYGIDGNKPSNSIELLSVVLHEIGHGLGFSTFVDISTGKKFKPSNRPQYFDDHFMMHLEDHSLGKNWPDMTDAERKASAIDTADLHWTGSNITAQVSTLLSGVNQGHVRMYAPSSLEGGSSVSHFSNALFPNELMEPFDTGPKQDVGLAKQLFKDVGWNLLASDTNPTVVINLPANNTGFAMAENITFQASADDVEDGNISSQISWASSIDGNLGGGNIIDVVLTSGSHLITVSVTDSDGNLVDASITVNVNSNPVVTINSPLDGENIALGSNVLFQATASDDEDGSLSSSVLWQSSIDGSLGAGAIMNTVLTLGSHQITASVTDSFLATSTNVVSVNVLGDSDLDGMNDAWEINNFGDLSRDGSEDFDGDGISDLDEYLISVTVVNGDINNDGQINTADLLLASNHINKVSILSALQIARCDFYPVNAPDGLFTVSDLIPLRGVIHNGP